MRDLLYLAKKFKGRIFFVGLLFSSAALAIFSAARPPQYSAHCSFQEAESKLNPSSGLSSALRLVNVSLEEKGALVAMQSETLMGRAIQKSGLQIWPKSGRELYLSNAMAQLKKECDPLEFSHTEGNLDSPLNFSITFTGPRTFDLFDERGASLGSGEVGVAAQVGGVQFTLAKKGMKKSYELTLHPLQAAIGKVRRQFAIRPDRQSPHLLHLSFSHSRRQAALTFLNELVLGYRQKLHDEHNAMMQKQLAYLKKRQAQVRGEYEAALAEHSSYLERSLKETGYLHLSQELSTLEKPRLELSSKQNARAVELKMWSALKPYDELLMGGKEQEGALTGKWRAAVASNQMGVESLTAQTFEGADLTSVTRLQEQVTQERAAHRAEIERLSGLKKRVQDPSFDVGALTDFFVDSVGRALVEKGSSMQLQLQDRANHSQKELDRLERLLQTQRILILDHVDRRISFLEEQWQNNGVTLAQLQSRALDLIKNEQELTAAQIQEIGGGMGHLPEKWRLENQIKVKRDFALQLVDGITQLTESKILENQFFRVESQLVDPPYAPPFPATIDPLFISAFSGLLGGSFCLGFLLLTAPLPVTSRFFSQRGDRWALRGQSDFFQALAYAIPTDQAVTLFAEGKKERQGKALAHLFAERGLKTLLVEIGEGEDSPEVEENLYWTANAQNSEKLNGPAFFAKLELWKKSFDVLLLSSPWSAAQCIHSPLKDHCSAVVVTIANETAREIDPLLEDTRTFFVLES
jgi:hypothetical protein